MLTKKPLLILLLVLATAGRAGAQEQKPQAKLYGFIRSYYAYDSRKCLTYSDDMMNVIPLDGDENAAASSRMLAITSRLGVDVSGGSILGAALSGKIEADFQASVGNAAVFRLRQAFVNAKWRNANLLVGQAWHPLSAALTPDVVSLGIGVPFNPFSRTPEIRFDYTLGRFTLTAAAMQQAQYTSGGPSGFVPDYARNAILPELYGAATFSKGGFTAGLGIDFLKLKIDDSGTSGGTVQSFSPIAFASYVSGKFTAKAKSVYAQNAAHLLMMSGYAQTAGGYEPVRSSSTWATISYGKRWKYSIFGGYMKNFGTKDAALENGAIYVRGPKNIDSIWRIAPSVSYNTQALSLGAEYENTSVLYSHTVTDHRFVLMVKYSF